MRGRRHLWADCQGSVGPLTSHNPMGLHGLLQGQLYFTLLYHTEHPNALCGQNAEFWYVRACGAYRTTLYNFQRLTQCWLNVWSANSQTEQFCIKITSFFCPEHGVGACPKRCGTSQPLKHPYASVPRVQNGVGTIIWALHHPVTGNVKNGLNWAQQ
jgi:hypothetical protein